MTRRLKTRHMQRTRNDEGYEIEKMLKKRLLNILPEGTKIKTNNSRGIDFRIYCGGEYRAEIKSARRWIRKKKDGVIKKWSARFTLKRKDYHESDFFIFVVKPVDENFDLDEEKDLEIHYVNTRDIREWLKERGRLDKHDTATIPVEEIRNLPGLDIVSYVKRTRQSTFF